MEDNYLKFVEISLKVFNTKFRKTRKSFLQLSEDAENLKEIPLLCIGFRKFLGNIFIKSSKHF